MFCLKNSWYFRYITSIYFWNQQIFGSKARNAFRQCKDGTNSWNILDFFIRLEKFPFRNRHYFIAEVKNVKCIIQQIFDK